jgi:hypothetical protein
MRLLLISALSIGCAAAQFVTPVPAVMPSWLAPYPGAFAPNKQMGNGVETSYTVAAAPRDVLTHFRTLFTSAGLPFEPSPLGYGFLIHEAAPECDLSISISRRDPNTAVKVTCSPRLASTERIANQQAQSRAERSHDDPMKKYDSPVYPEPKAPQAALRWPSWLVRTDGAKLTVEKFSGQLRSNFISSPTREGIQYFYAELLRSHGYRVKEGLAAVPEQFGSWVQANADPDNELGRRVSIWIKIKPAGGNFTVELSVQ